MTRSEFAQYTQLSDKLATLRRKLDDLRTAAERHEATSENSCAPRWVEFRAAIEASR